MKNEGNIENYSVINPQVDDYLKFKIGTVLFENSRMFRYSCAGEDLEPGQLVKTGIPTVDNTTLNLDIIYGHVVPITNEDPLKYLGKPALLAGIVGIAHISVKKSQYFWLELPKIDAILCKGDNIKTERRNEINSTKTNYQKLIKLGIATPSTRGIFKQPNIKFYYERLCPDEKGNPHGGVASICLIRIPAGTVQWTGASPIDIYVRGLSFCVPKDQFNKKEGRDAALGRAIQAVEGKKNTNPIRKRVSNLLAADAASNWLATSTFRYYSEYNVTLTLKEKSLFGIGKEDNG
jgi:hypothetical protein